jgi:hypothetical protein
MAQGAQKKRVSNPEIRRSNCFKYYNWLIVLTFEHDMPGCRVVLPFPMYAIK